MLRLKYTTNGVLRAIFGLLFGGLVAAWAMAPAAGLQEAMNNPNSKDPIQVGYAIITPTAGPADGLVVFETFGEHHGNDMTPGRCAAGRHDRPRPVVRKCKRPLV